MTNKAISQEEIKEALKKLSKEDFNLLFKTIKELKKEIK